MNPTTFLGMMSDISDEYIVSAANPHSKPIRWYQISAAAACIVLLISAAVYPKLRIQTPEITEPPESVAEVITTTTVSEFSEHSETQTATSPIQTTVTSMTVTENTTEQSAVMTTEIKTNASQENTVVTTNSITVRQIMTVDSSHNKTETNTKPATSQPTVTGTESTTVPPQRLTISVQKIRTSDIPSPPSGIRPPGSSENPQGDHPGGKNPESPDEPDTPPADAKIDDYYDYYEITFYDLTVHATLLSGQFDGQILTLQFMRLEYDCFSEEPIPEDTVQFRLELPDELKGKIAAVNLFVSGTTDPDVYSEQANTESEIIEIT